VPLFEGIEKFGDQIALLETDRDEISFRSLTSISDKVASQIDQRSLVFCLTSNTVESVIGYVGFQRAGHVCLMLNSKIDEEKLLELIDSFEPNYVWAPTSRKLRNDLNIDYALDRYQLVRTSAVVHQLHSDLTLLMGTSGSTGSPVMVRQSVMNLESNSRSIIQSLGLSRDDRAVTTLPMNYTYGLSIINSQLLAGGSVVMSESTLMDRTFWDQIEVHQPTYFGGVPYTYEMLNRIGLKKLGGSSVRMLTQAGGKLSSNLVSKIANECKDLDIEFCVMYGQTEATARMSVLPSNEVIQHPESIGRPIPGGTFKVVDLDSGVEVGTGEVGELVYSGPNVAMGYATSSNDLGREDEFNQLLHTGDLAKFDNKDLVYIVGRKKRFIKIYGNRINLEDVDNYLNRNGYEAVCTGKDDDLIVNVVSSSIKKTLAEEVARFLGVHKSSIAVREIDSIPRNDSGKILFSEIERRS
jgi:long-chain acyl-CoA synthetase